MDKFFKLKQQQQQQEKIDDTEILTEQNIITNCLTFLQKFFPEAQFTITYTSPTFIKSTQAISPDEWHYLNELFSDKETFLKEVTPGTISGTKRKTGGSRRNTKKTRTKKTRTKKTRTKKTKTKKTKTKKQH